MASASITALVFQSTPPAKGATIISKLYFDYQIISIHAPREGGDGLSGAHYGATF